MVTRFLKTTSLDIDETEKYMRKYWNLYINDLKIPARDIIKLYNNLWSIREVFTWLKQYTSLILFDLSFSTNLTYVESTESFSLFFLFPASTYLCEPANDKFEGENKNKPVNDKFEGGKNLKFKLESNLFCYYSFFCE